MTINLSNLAPGDAVAALRSYPRRYRSALAPIADDESVEELAQQIGPDGRSAIELAADAVRTFALLRQALHQIQITDTPTVHAGVADAASRHFEAPVQETVASTLEQLDDGAVALADEAASVTGAQWQRRADVAGGGSVTALDVVREAVRVGHDDLAAIERTLAALRR